MDQQAFTNGVGTIGLEKPDGGWTSTRSGWADIFMGGKGVGDPVVRKMFKRHPYNILLEKKNQYQRALTKFNKYVALNKEERTEYMAP